MWDNVEDHVANYGAQWLEVPKADGSDGTENYCFVLMQEYYEAEKLCFAENFIYGKMQQKYGIITSNYFQATYDCAMNGDEEDSEDPKLSIIPPGERPAADVHVQAANWQGQH